MSENTLIKVIDVNRYYGDTHAVKNLSFEVQSGQILGFLGPNGAGKSTTMQIISGSLSPSSGQILINGTDLIDNPIEARQQIGYLPEQPPLYKELTVDEYLQYCAQIRRVEKSQLAKAIDHAKQRCGLEQVSHKLIANLSKGYQQRVGIAQAIIHNPAVVILDEPTVGLDPIQIQEIRKLIIELGKEHGVILSTHILPEVQAVCNQVQIIREGELVYQSDMQTLQASMDQRHTLVRFNQAPDKATLQQLLTDIEIETQDEQSYLLSELTAEQRDSLLSASLQQNWGLRELSPQQKSLEQIFMDLTFQDSPQAQIIEEQTS